MQVASLFAPVADEYFPAPQSVQVAAPALDEYFPAAQPVQVAPPEIDVFPGAQSRHVASLVASVLGEYFPAPQPVQLTAPEIPSGGAGAKELAGHELQVSGSTRYFPAPHCAQSPRTEPPPLA